LPGVGQLVAGKYRIEGSLGVGGMGVVLAARHEAIGQKFAIKFLVVNDEEHRAEATARLLREARASASLRGEHVVQVFDVGELPNGMPYIVMERLDGQDLGIILRQVGSLPIPVALSLLVQACHAVSEAHRAGIVHRDLKPSNLFVVRRSDGKAWLKVVDFGISKSMRPDPVEPHTLTGAKIALGSPRYMSPEQVRDARSVDTRTDVWSLGVILYELIAGRPAFHATSYSGIYAAIVADPPPSLSAIRPEATADLEQVLLRCLARDPSARIQSVDELRTLLEPWAAADVEFDILLPSEPDRVGSDGVFERSGAQPALPPTQRAAGSPPSVDLTHSATRTQVSAGSPSSSGAVAVSQVASSRRAPLSMSEPRTRRSASDDLRGSSRHRELPGEPLPGRRAAVALGLLALFGGVLWLLRPSHEQKPAPPPPVRVVPLSIESAPPGARVSEGGAALGVTPLKLALTFASEAEKPRLFVLELPGYRPYVIEQGPASAAVVVRAELVPEPAPQPSPSAGPSVAPAGLPRSAPRPAPSGAPAPSQDPTWDIRLSR
jgi:serine/threonine protein kinase